jgi:hypothetical protein
MHILLIGATGVFGSRLLDLLKDEPGMTLILAGRRREKLEQLAECSVSSPEIAVLNRDTITGQQLQNLKIDVVVDAAGPFQQSQMTVIEAAIQAGCHYLDLADGRSFVTSISQFDAAARARNIAVISGASSVPALSHAVIDHLTAGWCDIATIKVGIFPGNRAPRGLSVVESILSYSGKPVRIFRQGDWQQVPGWGMTHRMSVPNVGTRWASVCDTPDQDLLVTRYKPKISAEFFAGLELSFLHLGLSFLSLFVRFGIVASLRPFAKPMLWIAQKFISFGSDRGGMVVDVEGRQADGTACHAKWSLEANANHGPYVPVLAAACLLRKLRDDTLAFHGATACTDLLSLADFQPDFDRLNLATTTHKTPYAMPVFAQALGARFDKLPAANKSLHSPGAGSYWQGTADVSGGTNIIARAISRLMRFPPSGAQQKLRVIIDPAVDGSETWHRVYPDRTMTSIMSKPEAYTQSLEEKFGHFAVRLKLQPTETGISMSAVSWCFGPVPLPQFLMPVIQATEHAEGGIHHFDVDVKLPFIGRLVQYRGQLRQQ